MKRGFLLAAMILVTAFPPGVAGASAPDDSASCVAAYSVFFAHRGSEALPLHRSDIAQHYAHEEQPAGVNVYSRVAEEHGSLEECTAG